MVKEIIYTLAFLALAKSRPIETPTDLSSNDQIDINYQGFYGTRSGTIGEPYYPTKYSITQGVRFVQKKVKKSKSKSKKSSKKNHKDHEKEIKKPDPVNNEPEDDYPKPAVIKTENPKNDKKTKENQPKIKVEDEILDPKEYGDYEAKSKEANDTYNLPYMGKDEEDFYTSI